MRKPVVMSVLAVLSLASLGTPAEGQRRGLVDVSHRSERHGLWMNVGLGAGTESYRFADQSGYTDGLTKPTFSFRMGGTVSPNLRLGGELIGWADSYYDNGDRVTEYLGGLMLIGQFYPSRDLGLFIKGGGGFSRSGVDVPGPFDTHEDGFAWTAGLGYEVKLSRVLFLTPTIDLMQHRSEARDEPALYERLVTFGVALTIQPGR